MINRNTDLIFGNQDLEFLFRIPHFPAFMGVADSDTENDKFHDLNVFISKGSGLVQVNPLFPLEDVYQDSHFSGEVGASWDLHHREFANFIEAFEPTGVIELGAGSGILRSIYSKNIPWAIIEPNTDIKESYVINDFFSEEISLTSYMFDTIVHSHFIEHVFDLNTFIKDIYLKLSSNNLVLFSVPNLRQMILNKFNNVLNFEHTVLITEEYIEYLFHKNNFKLLNKKYFQESHSIFYAYQKGKDLPYIPLLPNLYEINKKLMLDYIDYFKTIVDNLNDKLNDVDEYYLFGAHVFSQFMICLGLNTSKLAFILDNNVKKQGKRLYGTSFLVRSPQILSTVKQPSLIVYAGSFTNEIRDDIILNINKDAVFL